MKNVRVKIALLGDAAVGKTSLRRQFMGKTFQTQHLLTIGADFSSTNMKIGDYHMTYQIWDIAGQKNFTKLRSQFYKGVKGALCVFDVTREKTYQHLPDWINELWQNNGIGEIPIVILGNKSDLRDGSCVPADNAEEYASQIQNNMSKAFNISYLDTSAKTGLNVKTAFELLGEEIIRFIEV